MKAPTNSRPEPNAFMFRRQHPGESDEEYKTLMARAKMKFGRGKSGRAQAIKGMLQGAVGTHVPPEEAPGGADEALDK